MPSFKTTVALPGLTFDARAKPLVGPMAIKPPTIGKLPFRFGPGVVVGRITPGKLEPLVTVGVRARDLTAIDEAEAKMRIGNPSDYEPEYLAPTAEARALAKTLAASIAIHGEPGKPFPPPEFMASGDGSVHLRWRGTNGELLVSAPHDGGSAGQFLARGAVTFGGNVSIAGPNAHLARWILDNT